MQSEAVRLFVDRAMACVPAFAVTDQNAAAVLHICTQLDGIPLAIELAAARMKILAVEQIAARLEDRFRLLTGGSRTNPPRHRTLQAAIEWSYDLLSEKERLVWRRLSVFAGEWTLEAADAICSGTDVQAADILELLSQLVDKSLVMVDLRPGETRYRLLETMRQFAREKLVEAGEVAQVRRCHRDWYLGLAERVDPKLRGPEQGVWLERLETEHDNLRTALEWSAAEPGHPDTELRLAGALRWFWFIHGHWTEGRGWLEHALSRSDDARPTFLPKVLHGAAMLARFQGDHDRALALCERGLALSRELGDKESIVWFLIWLGAVALHQSDYDRAGALFAESLPLSRALEDKWLIIMTLANLGVVARLRGDYEQAAALQTESLALGREVGDRWRIAFSLASLGLVALQMGDRDRAAVLYRESLALCKEIQDRWIVHDCLDGLALVASAQGQYDHAARLLGAAGTLREILGYHPFAIDRVGHEKHVASVQAGLSDPAFAAAWAEGEAMTLGQAIEHALSPTVAIGTQPERSSAYPNDAHVRLLAPREREVATLVTQGHTNREIAALLGIAERTAETHVQHILNKLKFTSRAQIAVWATELGLHTSSAD
jgi:DNA-binding CsgD family transcriptional regulator/tetratricopeptide (TPR) repeat protein